MCIVISFRMAGLVTFKYLCGIVLVRNRCNDAKERKR